MKYFHRIALFIKSNKEASVASGHTALKISKLYAYVHATCCKKPEQLLVCTHCDLRYPYK